MCQVDLSDRADVRDEQQGFVKTTSTAQRAQLLVWLFRRRIHTWRHYGAMGGLDRQALSISAQGMYGLHRFGLAPGWLSLPYATAPREIGELK